MDDKELVEPIALEALLELAFVREQEAGQDELAARKQVLNTLLGQEPD